MLPNALINIPPPFKGLNIRIRTIIPIKGRGFINQRSTLQWAILIPRVRFCYEQKGAGLQDFHLNALGEMAPVCDSRLSVHSDTR